MAATGAIACMNFTIESPGPQLNPGWNSGAFNLNSYATPGPIYGTPACGTATNDTITGGPLTVSRNDLGSGSRCRTGLLTLGDGSLYCTVFPFVISQGLNVEPVCAPCSG